MVNEWGQRVGAASGRDRAGTALPHEQVGRIGQAGLFTAELINPAYQALTTRRLDDQWEWPLAAIAPGRRSHMSKY